MEKELNLSQAGLELNFFYSEELILEDSVKESLELLLSALGNFWRDTLKIDDKTFVLNFSLCRDEYIQELNKEHRNKNAPTDVLSFPLQDEVRAAKYDSFLPSVELGDIFVAFGVCTKQAEEFNLSFNDELLHLAVHGFLHLCGYDHELSVEEEILMEDLESKIIEDISIMKKQGN